MSSPHWNSKTHDSRIFAICAQQTASAVVRSDAFVHERHSTASIDHLYSNEAVPRSKVVFVLTALDRDCFMCKSFWLAEKRKKRSAVGTAALSVVSASF